MSKKCRHQLQNPSGMFNVVPQMNCDTYWLVTYTRIKRKNRPFSFMLKFLRKKFTIFYNQQLKISKKVIIWCPGAHRVLLFEDQDSSGQSSFEFPEQSGNPDKVIWVSRARRHSKKEYPEHSESLNKEYPVCSGTSNNNLYADFQLSTVKNWGFFHQKFQHKNLRPILPLRSGKSYKPIGNTIHP